MPGPSRRLRRPWPPTPTTSRPAFHRDKRDLPVCAIVVGTGGPKLTRNDANPDGLPSLLFRGLGVRAPPPTGDPNAPPGLFTAVQEQLGLKFESTNAPVEVLVIDRADQPSGN